MGSLVREPVVPNDDQGEEDVERSGDRVRLGDFLSGRFSEVDVESVEAVRRIRRRERE